MPGVVASIGDSGLRGGVITDRTHHSAIDEYPAACPRPGRGTLPDCGIGE